MDAVEQIKKFQEFIEEEYKVQLLENIRKDCNFLIIDFGELSKFDPELASDLLEFPEDVVKAAEAAVNQIDVGQDIANFKVRFKNISRSHYKLIKNVRSKDLGKLITIEGIVRQKSDVRPQVTSAKFECPNCGNVMNILQLNGNFKEPTKCGCGRKGKFVMLSKELVDAQALVLEESTENIGGGEQPKRLNVFLKEDLVSPLSEKKTNPGNKVTAIGILKEVPIILKTGSRSTRFDLMLEANYIDSVDETFYDVDISEEDQIKIREIARSRNCVERLVNSLSSSIYGYEKIKEALLLQLVGGLRKVRQDKVVSRGDIHILLVGDPGGGKSALLKRITTIAPKGRYVSGKGVSLEYNEPLLIKKDNKISIVKIGNFVNKNCDDKENVFVPLVKNIKALSLNILYNKLEWKKISHVFRHKSQEKLIKFHLETGREITVTKDHSIYILENGKVTVKKSKELTTNDYVLIPKKIPVQETNKIDEDYAKLLGYFIAEGHLHSKKGHYYKVEFTIGKNEHDIVNDLKRITKEKFGKELKINLHGKNDLRLVIHDKYAYESITWLLGSVSHKKAKQKRIPNIILNSNKKIRKAFINAYIRGDAGVTKSKELASDLAYLFLQDFIIASFTKKFSDRKSIIGERTIHNYGNVYELKSPKAGKEFDNRYSRPPFTKFGNIISKYFFKRMKTGKYFGDLRDIFGESILEYLGEHKALSKKHKSGRQMLVSITQEGYQLLDELIDFYSIINSDLGFAKIKKIEEVANTNEYVYDISIPDNENFIAGFGGIVCHNSGAGLTAAVVRDEFLKGWSLEAGALVLASDGIVCIDEMDKMSNEDRSAMHEALENQSVSISKANIQATLVSRTTVLAAANPKFGRFDPYDVIANQIDLPPTLINRFDLIFPIQDLPDESRDQKMAKHILSLHQAPDLLEPEIPTELLRKYIAYAKQKLSPKLTQEALNEIQDFYLKMRATGSAEGSIRAIPISARQLEALVRMSEASARLRLSEKVTKKDARRAINLLEYCLMQVGFDRETGKLDIDRIVTGITATQRSHIAVIKEIISELEGKFNRVIPIEEIVSAAKGKGVDEDKVEESLEKLKRVGDLYEPRHGFISKI